MAKRKDRLKGIKILHNDEDLLVVEKPSGLLTMGTDRDKTNTAYFILMDFVRKGNSKSRNRVFIVHRLDRETSGLLIFAKNEKIQKSLRENWKLVEKKYSVVVHGVLDKTSGSLRSNLLENKVYRVYSTHSKSEGIPTQTDYRVVSQKNDFSLLDILLVTGYKHQIRVHLADLGHPVVGDKKYGDKSSKRERLALHAREISFNHPSSGERLLFSSEVPAALSKFT